MNVFSRQTGILWLKLMLCEICNKNNATIHLTELLPNNIKKELHLCEQCAQQKNMKFAALGNFIDSAVENSLGGRKAKEFSKLKCPDCGITYSEFRNKSRFGCANDYAVFKDGVASILEKFHGCVEHHGKTPRQAPAEINRLREIKSLEKELDRLIRAENYEKAVEVRDKLFVLKGKK